MEQTIKCSICGEIYIVYTKAAGDVCPDCRTKADREKYGNQK
jgi:rubrerythrin